MRKKSSRRSPKEGHEGTRRQVLNKLEKRVNLVRRVEGGKSSIGKTQFFIMEKKLRQ